MDIADFLLVVVVVIGFIAFLVALSFIVIPYFVRTYRLNLKDIYEDGALYSKQQKKQLEKLKEEEEPKK